MLQEIMINHFQYWSFPGGASGKEPACQMQLTEEAGLTAGLGKAPGGGHGNPLPCSYLTLILVLQISVTNFSHMNILSCHMYVSRLEKL